MEEFQANTVSEDTTETIPEKTNSAWFLVPMEQEQMTPQPGDPSAASHCETTSKVEKANQLRLFVTLLTVRLLTKCHTVQHQRQEEWIAHTQRLIKQTLEGLDETVDFFFHMKNTKRVCNTVMRDLTKLFGGRHMLKSLLLLQDPAVDSAIIQILQIHIREFFARLTKKATSQSTLWKDVLQVMALLVYWEPSF